MYILLVIECCIADTVKVEDIVKQADELHSQVQHSACIVLLMLHVFYLNNSLLL